MKSLVIGASAGLGRALAQRLAEAKHDLFLVASDARDLDAISRDLSHRYGVKVSYSPIDLTAPDPALLRERVFADLGGINNLFYVAGVSSMDTGAVPDELVRQTIAVNFESAVRLINVFLDDLARTTDANIVTISSVAAARGRRVNSIYGAAKRGVEAYSESLRHRLVGSPCRVQCYRAGYLQTHMIFGQQLLFPALEPSVAAQTIFNNIGTDAGLVYLPRWWFPIITVIRLLPWFVFKKLNI